MDARIVELKSGEFAVRGLSKDDFDKIVSKYFYEASEERKPVRAERRIPNIDKVSNVKG